MSPSVWAVLAVLILANALYVAAEFGAVGVRRSRVRRMSDDGHWFAKRLLPHIDHPAALDQYVGASQVGITLSSLMLGAYAQATISFTLAPSLAAWFDLTPPTALSLSAIIILAVLTAVQLVVGELVPKALALQFPTQTALATVLPMVGSLRLFKPLIVLLNGAANVILRMLGAGEQSHRHLHSPEEIDLLIAESKDGGLLEPEEQQRLRRALRLGLSKARDLMVPRDRLTMLPHEATWDEMVRVVSASPFSRLPVIRQSSNEIIGTLRVKDLVERYVADGPTPLTTLMRPVVNVAPDLPADRVVTHLREHRVHSAVVVDSHGKALGLITIQDVLTELLGHGKADAAGAAR